MDYDVVVVGAGPAGSRTARDLARRGVRVALLEEHPAIGDPVHCSGLVTPRTLAEAGVGDGPSSGPGQGPSISSGQGLVRNRVSGAAVWVGGAEPFTIGGDRLHALVVDRRRLDELLAQQAQEAGAVLLHQARLTGVERVDGHVRLGVTGPQGPRSLDAWLVVGADGSRSTVARSLGFPAAREAVAAIGGEAALPAAVGRLDHVEVYLGADVAPGWFGWLIPVEERVVRLGIGAVAGVSPRRLLQAMVERVPHLRGARFLRLRGNVIPVRQRPRLYADNALLVGDAAGQAKATSGGGIWTGLVAGHTCARAALRALARGDLSARSLRWYQAAWRRGVGRHLAHAEALRDAFLRLRPDDWGRLAVLGHDPTVRAVLARYGDIDFPAGAAARLLVPWRLPCLLPHVPWHLWPVGVRLGLRWLLQRP